jgi:hypothetical protein
MNDTNAIFQKFKMVFMSDKNSQYILQLVSDNLRLQVDTSQYKLTLSQLQSLLYDTYIQHICGDLSKRGKLNLEEVLIILNKMTIGKLEQLIVQNQEPNLPSPQPIPSSFDVLTPFDNGTQGSSSVGGDKNVGIDVVGVGGGVSGSGVGKSEENRTVDNKPNAQVQTIYTVLKHHHFFRKMQRLKRVVILFLVPC